MEEPEGAPLTLEDIPGVEELINSPIFEDFFLGLGLLVVDPNFIQVKEQYASLEVNICSMRDIESVCDFLVRKYYAKDFMEKMWPVIADSLYRPAAHMYIEKLRDYLNSTHE